LFDGQSSDPVSPNGDPTASDSVRTGLSEKTQTNGKTIRRLVAAPCQHKAVSRDSGAMEQALTQLRLAGINGSPCSWM
jgi:hypothetical protein